MWAPCIFRTLNTDDMSYEIRTSQTFRTLHLGLHCTTYSVQLSHQHNNKSTCSYSLEVIIFFPSQCFSCVWAPVGFWLDGCRKLANQMLPPSSINRCGCEGSEQLHPSLVSSQSEWHHNSFFFVCVRTSILFQTSVHNSSVILNYFSHSCIPQIN